MREKMAEMTAQEAIATMRQFEMLDDEQIDEIAEVIERQEKIIELAIKSLSRNGKCPAMIIKKCYEQNTPFHKQCPPDNCWRKYLQSEVSK